MADSGWLSTGLGYDVGLVDGVITCRNGAGAVLRSVPAKVRESAAVRLLRDLATWLDGHADRCRLAVEQWMLDGVPVPATLLAEAWADPAWRAVLEHTVVAVDDAGTGVAGLLQAVSTSEAGAGVGVRLLDLAGGDRWIAATAVRIAHPARLADLAAFREFVVERDIRQGLVQLMREAPGKPADLAPGAVLVRGCPHDQLTGQRATARRLGYRMRDNTSVCRLVEGGRTVEARLSFGWHHGTTRIVPGQVAWYDEDGTRLPVAEVGPVAYAEGLRMAARLRIGASSAAARAGNGRALDADLVEPDAVLLTPPEDPAGRRRGPAQSSIADPTEPGSVRSYRHPGLGERQVVRLVGASTGRYADAVMAHLGFGAPEQAVPAGLVRRDPQRFPATILATRPELAADALAVTTELQTIIGELRDSTGHARTALKELAARYGDRPHLLAGMYDEAARVFRLAGSDDVAASTFEAARAAERDHNLPVDPDDRAAAYRGFAPILTNRSFTNLVADLCRPLASLTAPVPPDVAFEQVTDVWVRRCSAGVAPSADTVKAIKRLAKLAAGRGARAAQLDAMLAGVLDRVLTTHALAKAPADTFTQCRSALLHLGRSSAAVRAHLRAMFPPGDQWPARGTFRDEWLGLLLEVGAVADLTVQPDPVGQPDPAGQPEATGPGVTAGAGAGATAGPGEAAVAGWLGLVAGYIDRHVVTGNFPAVAATVAARIRADGVPVHLAERDVDVQILDILLAAGVPVAPRPEPAGWLTLTRWWTSDPATRRDLATVAADDRFGPAVVAAAGAWLAGGRDRTVDAFDPYPVLREVAGRWLTARITEAASTGLLGLRRCVEQLTGTTTRQSMCGRPEQYRHLAGVDVAGCLAAMLRAGVLDEFGWPALEEAAARLGGQYLGITGAWPDLVIWNHAKAIVVGRDAIRAEHELPILTKHLPDVMAAGTDLLVGDWRAASPQQPTAWLGHPASRFTEKPHQPVNLLRYSFALPGGGRTYGDAPLVPGATTYQQRACRVYSDGTRFWRHHCHGGVFEEFDPDTGESLGATVPAFFAGTAAEPGTLEPHFSSLAPLPYDRSVLGTRGGLVGTRARSREDGSIELVSIDGRRFSGRKWQVQCAVQAPCELLGVPGDPAPRPVFHLVDRYPEVRVLDPTGTIELAFHPIGRTTGDSVARWPYHLPLDGTPVLAPPAFWHNLTVRDEAGSMALRSVTIEAASALLAAAAEEAPQPAADRGGAPGTPGEPASPPGATADRGGSPVELALAEYLPEITHPGLRAGVLGLVRYALLRQRDLAELVAARRPEPATTTESPTPCAAESTAPCAGLPPSTTAGVPGSATAGVLPSVVAGVPAPVAAEVRPSPAAGTVHGDEAAAGLADFDPDGWFGSAGLRTVLAVADFLDGRRDDLPEASAGHDGLPWLTVLGHPGAVALRAVSPDFGDATRSALLDLLERWSETSFVRQTGRLRAGRVAHLATTLVQHTAGVADGGRYVCVTQQRFGSPSCTAMLIAPEPVASQLDRLPLAAEFRTALRTAVLPWPASPVSADWLRRFVALARVRGPLPWSPAAIDTLGRATGLSRAEAAVLWAALRVGARVPAGFPAGRTAAGSGTADEPGGRTAAGSGTADGPGGTFGISAVEARHARAALAAVPPAERMAILNAALPDDPAELWDAPDRADGPVTRLARSWVARRGRATALPADAATISAVRAVAGDLPILGMLRMFVEPDSAPELTGPTAVRLVGVEDRYDYRGFRFVCDDRGITAALLVELARYLPWAATTRPVGDPLLAGVPRLLELLVTRLADPTLLVDLGDIRKLPTAFDGLAPFGTTPLRPGRGWWQPAEGTARDGGDFVAIQHGYPGMNAVAVLARPALVAAGERSSSVAAQLEKPVVLHAVEALRSAGYAAMARRAARTPVPAGGYEANPAQSVPDLVAEVSRALRLSADAAALYLQLLTMAAPTDAAVRTWNGWKPARHTAAARELAAATTGAGAPLVVSAKRARASRSLFLPGTWIEARNGLPVEAWKLPLHDAAIVAGKAQTTLGRWVPPRPLHELFTAAWQRLRAGDHP